MCKIDFPEAWTTITLPVNGIDAAGQSWVQTWLHVETSLVLPEDWDWRWRVDGRGEYVGSFPKRIAKFVWQQTGARLSPAQLGALGSGAEKYVEHTAEYCFRFTHDFGWQAGDYGDEGSCYFGNGCRPAARTMLANDRAWAVQFCRPDNHWRGIARAWVCQRGGCAILFNAYGLDPVRMTRVLSHYWGAYYSTIALHNNGSFSGELWINGNKPIRAQCADPCGRGYVIGAQVDVEAIGSCLDLQIPESDERYADDDTRCSDCGRSIDDDDAQWADDDGPYCESCFDSRYSYCNGHEGYADSDDVTEINGSWYCSDCVDRLFRQCAHCDELIDRDDILTDPDDDYICADCHDDLVGVCADCGEEFWRFDLEDDDGDDVCADCLATREAEAEAEAEAEVAHV